MHHSNALPHTLGLATLTALAIGLVVASRAPRPSLPVREHTVASAAVEASTPRRNRLMVPVTSTQPSMGPQDALVTLVLWSGLRGRAARDMDAAVRVALVNNDDVRVVYRHQFDRRDPDAVRMHQVAHAVHYHADKFWALRQKLLTLDAETPLPEPQLKALVESVGVPWSVMAGAWQRQGIAQHVAADQVFGFRFGVGDAPTLFVNGRRIDQAPRTPLRLRIQQAIDQERVIARRLLAQGVARSEVYETVTRAGAWDAGDDRGAQVHASQGW